MKTVYIILGIVVVLWIVGNLNRHKRAKNAVIYVDKNSCVGCQRCIKRCKHKVLEKVNDENGTRVVVKNPNKCTACGDCISGCRYDALRLVERIKKI
jgi:NAD-dependent dihydropyrimidine dehydrogenase PreA subunit